MTTKVKLVGAKEKAAEPKGLAAPLKNWDTLMAYFKTATENELWKLLEYELKHRKRISFSLRVYGKASDMRTRREKRQILTSLSK